MSALRGARILLVGPLARQQVGRVTAWGNPERRGGAHESYSVSLVHVYSKVTTNPMRRTVSVLALTPALCITLLSGCSGGTAPAAPDTTVIATSATSPATTTTAPTTVSTATDSPPAGLAQRFAKSEVGAKAFTLYVFSVLNDAFRTGDDTELRRVISKSCKRCALWADTVAMNGERGWKLDGEFAHLTKVRVIGYRDGRAPVLVNAESKRDRYLDSSGRTVGHIDAFKGALALELVYDRQWRVVGTFAA